MRYLFVIIFLTFGAIDIQAAVDTTDELHSYPPAFIENSNSCDLQDTKFNIEVYNEILRDTTALILALPIGDNEKIKSIKQTAQILQGSLGSTHSFDVSEDIPVLEESLFSKDRSGSGMVDDILQLPLSVDDKVKCIKFIQERIDIYDFGSEPDLRLNYLEHLLICFYDRSWEACPQEFRSGQKYLKNDIKLLVQNGFYKLDHIDSDGLLHCGEKIFNAKELLKDILNDKI